MTTVLRSAPNFSLSESKRYVINVVTRILLGYSVGGLAVILRRSGSNVLELELEVVCFVYPDVV